MFALSGGTWVGRNYRGSSSSDMNIFLVSSISEAIAVPAEDIEEVRYFAQLTESLPTLVRLGTGEILLQAEADSVRGLQEIFVWWEPREKVWFV